MVIGMLKRLCFIKESSKHNCNLFPPKKKKKKSKFAYFFQMKKIIKKFSFLKIHFFNKWVGYGLTQFNPIFQWVECRLTHFFYGLG